MLHEGQAGGHRVPRGRNGASGWTYAGLEAGMASWKLALRGMRERVFPIPHRFGRLVEEREPRRERDQFQNLVHVRINAV